MTRTYGSVPSPRSLAPLERDPASGRRGVRRDDKDRSSDRSPRRPRGRWLVGGAVVAAVVAVVAVAAVAVVGSSSGGGGGSSDAERAAARKAAEAQALSLVPGTTVTQPAFEDPPAGAIELTYRGGTFTRRTCTNLLGGGCAEVEFDFYDSVTLRCTPEGCTLLGGDLGSAPLAGGAASVSGTTPHGSPECGTQETTITVRASGTATTHGIEHPARLTGRATNDAPASVHPTANCLGRNEIYEFDATPR